MQIEGPTDLTADWLTAAIGAGTVTEFTADRIGTGQMSECYRIGLGYADGATGPASVVLKVAATDPMSRQTGAALGLYEREVRFYTDVAPQLGGQGAPPACGGERSDPGINGAGPVAPCYHASFDPATGFFDLLLGDAAPAVVGDELRGATLDQATLALSELARLHGPLMGDATLAQADWLNREAPISQALLAQLYAGFVDRYGDLIAPHHRLVCERLVAGFDAYLAEEAAAGRIHGLVHGDYRLDNLLFGGPEAERALTVVDWQTVTWGPVMTDVAYFLGCALPAEDRRAHYDTLLRTYFDGLGPKPAIDIDAVRDGVRRQSFFGVMMAIVSSMLVERTERGDQMFMTMLDRHCQHVLDAGALDVLPAATTPEPLQPAAADEAAHPAGDEPLWSESWYWDFADPEQGIGGWARLGLIPNQNTAWLNVLVCGPSIPTVALLDFHAALPTDPGAVRTDTMEVVHTASAPLQAYRVAARGSGQAYDDPAALLRGEPGQPADVEMDLVWTTVGTPYQYRITPRYEIPCTVSGTVSVAGRTFRLDAVAGQRDHSWGVRDWWSMDWVWSALHLDDGVHLHGVDIRIPGAPPIGIGYVQSPGEPLVELQAVRARATFADNGLPLTTTLNLDPGGLTASIDIQGHAPVLLVADDGRVSRFPRAWATVRTADGRSGVGWVEWNRSQPED